MQKMFCKVIDYAKLYIIDVSHKYADAHIADKYRRCKKKTYAEQYSAERKTRLSRPTLSRPKKYEVRDKKQDYIDESKRVEVERKFSLAKRKCGIELTVTKYLKLKISYVYMVIRPELLIFMRAYAIINVIA